MWHGIFGCHPLNRHQYDAFYKPDSYKLSLAKEEAKPWNKAQLGQVFEALTENQKFGW